MRKSSGLLFVIIALLGCVADPSSDSSSQADRFDYPLVSLYVDSLEVSIGWYSDVLQMELSAPPQEYPDYHLRMAFLEKPGFHLELVERANSLDRGDALPSEEILLGGFFKMGFSSQDIDALYRRLQALGTIEFVTDVQDLPPSEIEIPWPTRHLLITDPDGNFVQFFSYDDQTQIDDASPWLMMVTVGDLDAMIPWYQKNLSFVLQDVVGEPGNRRAILSRGNRILEVFEPSEVVTQATFPENTAIHGIAKLGLSTSDMAIEFESMQSNEVNVLFPPEEGAFEWATEALIITDPEGNWIQFLELKD